MIPSKLSARARCRTRLNQAGFGLIEVLVVTAVVGIIMASITSMLSSMHRLQTYASARAGKSILIDDLHQVFSNNALCTAALKNKTLGVVGDQPSIGLTLDGEPEISPDSPTALADYGVIVQKLYMSQIAPAGTGTQTLFIATINAALSETQNGAGSTQIAPRALAEATIGSVYIKTAGVKDRTIVSCFTTSGRDDLTMQAVCPLLGGTWNATASNCNFSGKSCNLGDNQNLAAGLHQIIPGPNWGPWLPNSIIGGSLGLGTNPQSIMYAGHYYTTASLSDAELMTVEQIKNGKIPSGISAGTGTNTVCVDGQWVDSGVVASTAGDPDSRTSDGGDASSGDSGADGGE